MHTHDFNISLKNEIPTESEPHFVFRYKVHLPSEFRIENPAVQEVKLPEYTNCGCWFKNPWSDLELKIINMVAPDGLVNTYKNLKMKNFDIVVEQLDPTGVGISYWKIRAKKISSLDFGHLKYEGNGLHYFIVRFEVKDVAHKFAYELEGAEELN